MPYYLTSYSMLFIVSICSLSEGSCKPTEQACLCKAPKVPVYTKAIIADIEDAQPCKME